MAINLSNRPFFGPLEVGGSRWKEVTPDLKGPGKATDSAQARPAALPLLTLEPWGFRIFQRSEQGGR